MKESDQIIKTLHFMTLPATGQTAVLENSFALMDNIDFLRHRQSVDLSEDPVTASVIPEPYPFRISFNLVIVCLAGSMKGRINTQEYDLHGSDAIVVLPGSIGEDLRFSHDCCLMVVAFAEDSFVSEMNLPVLLTIKQFLSRHTILHMSDDALREFADIYARMKQKILQPDYIYKKDVVKSYLQILCCGMGQLMLPHIEYADRHPGPRSKQICDRFIAEVRNHYRHERSVTYYADRLCLTPKYLAHIVLTQTGRYAADWIRDYVLLEAKAMLGSGQYTVQQVADYLNFPNQSAFGVYFKRGTGCSPGSYRRQ